MDDRIAGVGSSLQERTITTQLLLDAPVAIFWIGDRAFNGLMSIMTPSLEVLVPHAHKRNRALPYELATYRSEDRAPMISITFCSARNAERRLAKYKA